MINTKDIKIDIIYPPKSRQQIFPFACNIVKVSHLPSGIVVTKEGKSQLKARNEAFEELEMLIELWENG